MAMSLCFQKFVSGNDDGSRPANLVPSSQRGPAGSALALSSQKENEQTSASIGQGLSFKSKYYYSSELFFASNGPRKMGSQVTLQHGANTLYEQGLWKSVSLCTATTGDGHHPLGPAGLVQEMPAEGNNHFCAGVAPCWKSSKL